MKHRTVINSNKIRNLLHFLSEVLGRLLADRVFLLLLYKRTKKRKMRKTLLSIGIFIACILLIGAWMWFRFNWDVETSLLIAEKQMTHHPDSALVLLQQIEHPEYFRGKNSALYALLKTQAQYKNYLPVENDSLIRVALDYFSTGKDSLRKAWTYYYMAQVCRDMHEEKKAVGYFQQAATAAEKSDNYKLQGLIYYHWGNLLQTKKPYEEGLGLLKESEKYARLNKDTASVITILGEIGWSYVWMKDYEQAHHSFLQGVELAKILNKERALAIMFHKMGVSYYKEKQYAKALDYINLSLTHDWNKEELHKPYCIKGRALLELQQYDSARYYIEKGKSTVDYYAMASYHDEMSLLEGRLGNYRKALEHRTIYANYLDSIDNKKDDQYVMELQKKYDYSIVKNENDLLKIKTQRRNIVILVITLIAVCLIFAYYYRYNSFKTRTEHIIHSKDLSFAKSLNQLKQQHEETLSAYENQQLKLQEEIFQKNEVVMKIENLKVIKDVDKIKFKSTLVLSEQELSSLLSVINACYDDFASRLHEQFIALTLDDIYICCLLRMKIPSQDIMVLLDINEEALKKRKYRIKRVKLSLSQTGISLEEFLLSY